MRGGGGYGFSYQGSGGTDGGDGEEGYSAPGGNGAGEDISEYNTFLAFSLSPGAGGQYVGNLYGGGGGGVLINGAGPVASINHGQGYGGGGPGGLEGLPGVILIEISPTTPATTPATTSAPAGASTSISRYYFNFFYFCYVLYVLSGQF